MAAYVLVHGGWSGAHGFRHVRRRVAAAGHEVFTPSLTGIGERAHLASPMINLSTHVRDVVNQVLYEDLTEIVLLGFSYGGFVVTGALEHIAERVRHLVYLDAFVPDDGETALGHTLGIEAGPAALDQDWLVPPPERTFDDPAEGTWMTARRTPHPIGCFTERVRLARPLEEFAFARTYIKATLDPPPISAPTRCCAPPNAPRHRRPGATASWPPRTSCRATAPTSSPSCCSIWTPEPLWPIPSNGTVGRGTLS